MGMMGEECRSWLSRWAGERGREKRERVDMEELSDANSVEVYVCGKGGGDYRPQGIPNEVQKFA
jgi:hypothetical protein